MFVQYKARAIGSGSEGAQQTLQDKYRDVRRIHSSSHLLCCFSVSCRAPTTNCVQDLAVSEAEDLAIEVLKQVMEEKVTNQNIELAIVDQRGFRLYNADQLSEVIARA